MIISESASKSSFFDIIRNNKRAEDHVCSFWVNIFVVDYLLLHFSMPKQSVSYFRKVSYRYMKKDKNEQQQSCKMTSIGGQALMEGIMMRGPERTAMAVRNAKGEIVLEDFPTPVGKGKIRKLPFIRGIFNMISSLTLGYKCLMRSADIAISDAEEADRLEREKKLQDGNSEEPSKPDDGQKGGDSEEPSKPDDGQKDDNSEEPSQPDDGQKDGDSEEPSKPDDGQKGEKKNSSSLTTVVMVIGVVLGLALSIGLFIALPSYAFLGFSKLFNIDLENSGYFMSLFRSFFEGVLKIFILVLYMLIVSKMKDIHRTFMYHGAEHKTIFCYEQGLELTVENVRKQRRLHPRCGTSFLILVLIVSMFIGFFIPSFLPTYLRVIIKIANLCARNVAAAHNHKRTG